MIQYTADSQGGSNSQLLGAHPSTAFVAIWTTGPDPSTDGLFRIQALRPDADGGWVAFDQLCNPFPDAPQSSATARMAREYGVHQGSIEGCPDSRTAWEQLEVFLGEASVVSLDGRGLEVWSEALGSRGTRIVLGLDELAQTFLPGRLSTHRNTLLQALLPGIGGVGRGATINTPEALVCALAELLGRFLASPAEVVAVALGGLTRALVGLQKTTPPAAARLSLALQLVDKPSRWARSTGELFTTPDSLQDGCLRLCPDPDDDLTALLDGLPPAAGSPQAEWQTAEELPTCTLSTTPGHHEDVRMLDDLFEHHLPALLAQEHGQKPEAFYRKSQHGVAQQVFKALSNDELLLVHAPTGTGKTLAYLLPAILWARRHKIRVAIATYTRALQEQAMEREVPRALTALARAGLSGETRISVLKGQENYLCMRALRSAVPDSESEPEAWLAWTGMALFALTDLDGDLDRLPSRPPVRMADSETFRATAASMLQATRARSGCCVQESDKATCCAALASRKASRSHVVITNQALALARVELFRHVVFDECEHLHSVAHSTWSHSLSFGDIREVLLRLHKPGKGRVSRPLNSLNRKLALDAPARNELEKALRLWGEATRHLHTLEQRVEAFDQWRQQAMQSRPQREEHSAFREYVSGDNGRALLEARMEVSGALGHLEGSLERLLELAAAGRIAGFTRTRRALELGRAGLVDLVKQLTAWLPEQDGQPTLSDHVFHDVDRNPSQNLVLNARLLLPDKQLGEVYYPTLACAVFLSATTRLAAGFQPAMAYLGLDRTQRPDPEDNSPGREVRTFSVPEVFDYSRVLVGLPRDIPNPSNRPAHQSYVAETLEWLATRTRGRMLVLLTSLADVRAIGESLCAALTPRQTPVWYQGMSGIGKEEMADLFRERDDSVLLGVDTFWYGADFPGETLEYLVIARLPYGVPDSYHHAQCAAMGESDQRRRVYMPRALAKLRQGFGRLMRRTSDRGCVLLLDPRIGEARHRAFLRELPIRSGAQTTEDEPGNLARLVRGDSRLVLHECLAHMDMLNDVKRRGLSVDYEPTERGVVSRSTAAPKTSAPIVLPSLPPEPEQIHIAEDDLPF